MASKNAIVDLFEKGDINNAIHILFSMEEKETINQLSIAFQHVPKSPRCFLDCLENYLQEHSLNSNVTMSIAIVIKCIRSSDAAIISKDDGKLAGSLLVNFLKDLRINLACDFALVYQVPQNYLVSFTEQMISNKNIKNAVQFMHTLNIKNLFHPDVILALALEKEDIVSADTLVTGNIDAQYKYVNLLLHMKFHDRIIKKRISKFKLDQNAFPEFVQRRQRATIRFLVYSMQFEDAYDLAAQSEELKMYICNVVLHEKGPKDPVTKQFVYRSKLYSRFEEVDISQEVYRSLDDRSKDDLPPLPGYLSLYEIICKKDVSFINESNDLLECVNYLSKKSVIGFDCEWKPSYKQANGEGDKCALLQLACDEKTFVIDMLEFKHAATPLNGLFESDTIIKVGFDIKGDIKAIRSAISKHGQSYSACMRRLLDIQLLHHNLKTSGKSTTRGKDVTDEDTKSQTHRSKSNGLSDVALTYLGKPLDKRVRMSNWERRPLTAAQLHYAALDAHVLIQIYRAMQASYGSVFVDEEKRSIRFIKM